MKIKEGGVMDIQIGAQVKIINPDDTAEYGIEVGDEGVVVWIGEYASYGVCIPKKSDVYAYALNDLEIIKPFQVPEGFILVERERLDEFYQDDDEPENFCSNINEIDILGENLDIGDVMIINKITSAHVSTEKLYAVLVECDPVAPYFKRTTLKVFDDYDDAHKTMIEAAQEPK